MVLEDYEYEEVEVYVPDTSVVVEGIVSKLIMNGEIKGKIALHRAILSELEGQANQGKVTGFVGLEEIKRIRDLADKGVIEFEIVGDRPRPIDIQYAKYGTIDAMIRDYAWENTAILVTGDRTQAEVAKAMGLKVLYIPPKRELKFGIQGFFDSETMSIHLKEGVPPRAKKGRPGKWYFTELSNKLLTRSDIESLANEIIEVAKSVPNGFIEIDRAGSTIIQIGGYRVIITRPPMSDGWEITAVKPIVKLNLNDYGLPDRLMERLEEKAEGILIAGAPGMGKTTFAQALAEFYASKNKIVKTIESPRDMQLPESVTQYSKTYASNEELHDILLLSRPDYTFFDEMRNDEDFRLYTDLRLAGIGMVGVVHATSPIDAIQRFIGRVELGMIPSIIDTLIFIDCGEVAKVYELKMTVKLPTGLQEADLARPVIEVRDFITGELEYEIYTFGEETVVIPIKRLRGKRSKLKIEREIERLLPEAEIQVGDKCLKVIVPRDFSREFQKRLSKLRRLESRYGVAIEVEFAKGYS